MYFKRRGRRSAYPEGLEVMAVARVGARVELDDAVMRSVDTVAEQLGRSREEVLEDFVRRGLAARNLGDVLARARTHNDLSEDQATRVAYDELKAARAARRANREVPGSTSDSPLWLVSIRHVPAGRA